jgi:hypothetical protein
VGALGHYLEAEGVPTTQISLIREHTETIQPPRALWVPFELGRPLGPPSDADLQRRVLSAALELFQEPQGPVLADFPDENIGPKDDRDPGAEIWSCPVSFAEPSQGLSGDEALASGLREEAAELRNWYDLRLKEHGRTSMVHFEPDGLIQLLNDYLVSGDKTIEGSDLPFAAALRLAAQDLKTFYFESVAARPGATAPDNKAFNRWFWSQTAAGRVLKAIKEKCLDETDEMMRMNGKLLLVPMDQG